MEEKRAVGAFRGKAFVLAGMLALSAVVWMVFGGWGNAPQKVSATEFHMNTSITITVYSRDRAKGEALLRKAFDEIDRLEGIFEPLKGQGFLQKVNSGPTGAWWEMNPDFRKVLERSRYFYNLSGGAFDPAIGPAKWLWDFENGGRIPNPLQLSAAMKLADLRKVEVQGNRFRLTVPGSKLDFGGVAKGYAVDRMAAALRENGAESALINAGGNITIIGRKPDKSDWVIGVRHPRKEETILVTPLPNVAVATSGDYERFFMQDGVRYHHLLDPRDGYPARKCISATVWTDNAMDADILSTTMFVLGPEKGVDLAEKLRNVETLIYFEKDGKIQRAMSSGVVGKVKP